MKILVISLAGIGDTLLATPLIHELRANFPDAAIDALVLWAGARDLLETNPYVRCVHQKNLLKESKLNSLRFLWSLRAAGYDMSINTHPQSRIQYRVAARIVAAPTRLSHDYECSGWLDRWLVNCTRPQDYSRHTVENNFDLLQHLGGAPKLPQHSLEVFLSPEEEAWADAFINQQKLTNVRILGMHVGSGGTKNLRLKRWPLTQYVELVKRLQRELPEVTVLLFGGPEELPDHEQLRAAGAAGKVITAKTSNLRQAAALLKRCTAFLSVDTALMHLAAAVKARGQIVIETPTLHTTNLPYGNPFTVVPNPAVSGRQLEFYRYDGRGIRGTEAELIRCMTAVSPEAVLQVVKPALSAA